MFTGLHFVKDRVDRFCRDGGLRTRRYEACSRSVQTNLDSATCDYLETTVSTSASYKRMVRERAELMVDNGLRKFIISDTEIKLATKLGQTSSDESHGRMIDRRVQIK